jgi:predicted transcriptional regulator YheO
MYILHQMRKIKYSIIKINNPTITRRVKADPNLSARFDAKIQLFLI